MYNSIMKTVAMEAIDFQRDNFGKQLEDAFTELQEEKVREGTHGKIYKAGKKIEALVYERIGLTIDLTFEKNEGPAILPPHIDKNHVFLVDYKREFMSYYDMSDSIKKLAGADKISKVDSGKAKISGVYSEIPHTLWLPVWFINNNNLTVGEKVAIFLHEIGHGFTFLEYIGKMAMMNEMLQIVTCDAFDTSTAKEREIIVMKSNITGDKDKQLEEQLSSKSKSVRTVALLKILIDPARSSLGSLHYDATMCESLADNFAARFGYAKDLVIGLDKLSTYNPDRNGNIRALAVVIEILQYLSVVALFMGVAAAFTQFLVVKLISRLLSSGEANEDYTYDRLRVRYLRVREQVIQELKDTKLPKEAVDRLVDDIKTIDNAIKGTKDFRSLTDKMYNFIFSKHRNALSITEQQRQLEEIASNDLFIKSAQLRTSV